MCEIQKNEEQLKMKEKYEDLEEVKQEISRKDILIEDMKGKIKMFEEVCFENDKNSEILSRLYDRGIINEAGDILNKGDEDDCMWKSEHWWKANTGLQTFKHWKDNNFT